MSEHRIRIATRKSPLAMWQAEHVAELALAYLLFTDSARIDLRSLRRSNFGVSTVTSIALVQNDWYMSEDRVIPLHVYTLR